MIQYDSVDIARHLIYECQAKGITDINNTKINKLLYAFYGMYLAIYDKEILTEIPKYFPYGPVFPRVYTQYDDLKPLKIDLGQDEKDVVDFVMKAFANISAGKLSTWSHESGTPWDKMKQRNSKYSDPLNPIEVRDYFINLFKISHAQ